jgi:hypothetical protein
MTAPFARYIGIDYSGAETPTASLKGLRVYLAEADDPAAEVPPPPSPRRYWTRRGIAEWLIERLAEDVLTLVGIDHGFSFPLRYFEMHHIKPEWPVFLDDFQRHWPTDQDYTYVDFVRDGLAGNGAARTGSTRWRRLTEERARGPNPSFTSMSPARLPNPPMPGFPGCVSSGWVSAAGFTSGRSTAGTSRPAARPSPKCIRHFGGATSRAPTAPTTSTTPTVPPSGCDAPVATAASRASCIPA